MSIAGETGTSREAVQVHLKRMRGDPNPTVSFRIIKDKKHQRILYKSLTSITTTTPLHDLHPLQVDECVRDCVSDCKGKGYEANSSVLVRDVRDISISQFLGMSVEETLTLWQQQGAPIIYLGRGESCEDLRKLLTKNVPRDFELQAVKEWLEKNVVTMARS